MNESLTQAPPSGAPGMPWHLRCVLQTQARSPVKGTGGKSGRREGDQARRRVRGSRVVPREEE